MTGDPARAVGDVLEAACVDGTTPGAAAVVFVRDGRRLALCRGALHRQAGAPYVDEDTVWDLASLTKLLCTTMLAARAMDEGRLALGETPWPQWPGVTIEHVLRHESGLPGWLPLFEEARRRTAVGLPAGRKLVEEAAAAASVDAPPGVRTVYSDIGFIALGALLERRFGRALDELFADAAHAAYGATGLRFVRLDEAGFHPRLPRVAPTERCPWRRRAIHGQVHDENCFAMGGVAGHAGLFGSLRDVEQAARGLLGASGSLETFAEIPAEKSRRPVGWDRTTPGGSTGDALGARTVGHLAFTGCSLWIDREAGAGYVLLTNRIHETRESPEKILAVRRAFHRAAAAWVTSS